MLFEQIACYIAIPLYVLSVSLNFVIIECIIVYIDEIKKNYVIPYIKYGQDHTSREDSGVVIIFIFFFFPSCISKKMMDSCTIS